MSTYRPSFLELRRLGWLAAASKKDGTRAVDAIAGYHAELVDVFDDEETDTQGYAAVDLSDDAKGCNRLLIVFRGTTDLRDVATDCAALRRTFAEGGMVHAGYLTAYNRLAGRVRSVAGGHLQSNPNAQVRFVGHSMGGALATLGAANVAGWWPNGRERVSCVTFGSPRVGDSAFVTAFTNLVPRSTRVVHGFDVVPTLPAKLIGYTHVGDLLHVLDDGSTATTVGSWLRQLAATVSGRGLSDHHMGGYAAALVAAASKAG